ncbi:uncharacterized protein CEXT_683761 [Caerostris extrusa]|uniref:Peroxin-7 n=1 Tax=Caerostris extrusa TaxID=172846 RepID=A0AAV4R9L5_CAEEX|nr:uncharacterized protein CEXT_683761 [Caerostris extrusa]
MRLWCKKANSSTVKFVLFHNLDKHGKDTYVYCVAWNQVDARKIASGGDGTCMIHQTDGKATTIFQTSFYSGTDQPLKVLSGHSGKAFSSQMVSFKKMAYFAAHLMTDKMGLVWCPELPNIVISGSWDSTIAVWDISDGACLDIIEDHGADVYGLSCHTQRPFMLASTSRDSTVRFWSMLPLVSSLYLKILVSYPLSDIFHPSGQ